VGVLVTELPFFGVGLSVGGVDVEFAVPQSRLAPAAFDGAGVISAFGSIALILDSAPAVVATLAKEPPEVVAVDCNASPGSGRLTPSLCTPLPRSVSGASST
jgi:hypothetical protein